MIRSASRPLRAAAVTVTTAATVAAALSVPGPASGQTTTTANPADCPAVFALGVQGTGQSSATSADPTQDTGFLSNVFTRFMADGDSAKTKVMREYLPYDTTSGLTTTSATATGTTSSTTYDQAVSQAVARMSDRLSTFASQCPRSAVALVGYQQGAKVVSLESQIIGAGSGPVPANQVAAVALIGDPTRPAGATTFPGLAASVVHPAAVPGTKGDTVAGITDLNPVAATGGGVGATTVPNYGALVGRVASFCISGDLSCDTPQNAPLLKAVAQVAGTVQNPGDPIQAIGAIATSLGNTAIKTATNVINSDISGDSLWNLSINPQESISQRIADASDPSVPPDPAAGLHALLKLGTLALNSVVSLAQTVLTADTIAEVGAAGMADPIAGLAVLGAKLAFGVAQLVSPTTAIGWIQQAFQALISNIDDNRDLITNTTWIKYSDVLARRGSYQTDPATPDGASVTAWVADWMAAAAQDVAAVPPPTTTASAFPTLATTSPATTQTTTPTTTSATSTTTPATPTGSATSTPSTWVPVTLTSTPQPQ